MSALTDLLLQGPRSAPELRRSLAISQATFSRFVSAHGEVLQFGKARATRYALLRPVRGISTFPLWQVNAQGSCLVERTCGEWQWFDGLPGI